MARDLVLEVLTKAEGKGLRDTADGLDRTATSSDDMGKAFHEASQESGLLDHELGKVHETGDKTTQSFKEATKEGGLLEAEIKRVTAEIKRLGVEFDATGNTALLKDIGSNRSMLTRLKKVAADLKPVLEETGKLGGVVVSDSIFEALKAVPFKQALIPGLVGAAVLAAPAIGTVIAGAITTAVGLGGIGLGILAASHEPRVISAATEAGHRISAAFFGSGTALVAPIEHALDILADDFEQLHLGDTFAILAPEIADLASGIGGLAKEFMPGFNQALKDGAPVIKEVSQDLPTIGHALGDMLQQMAEGKGNVEGLKDTIYVLNTVMHDTGATMKFLSDNFHSFKGVVGLVGDGLDEMFLGFDSGKTGMQHLNDVGGQTVALFHRIGETASDEGHEVTHFGDAFKNARTKAHDAATEIVTAVERISDAIDNAIGGKTSFEDSLIAWQRGLTELGRIAKENGKSLAINNTHGQDNLEIINQQVKRAEDLRQKTFEQTHDIKAANTAYDKMLSLIEASLVAQGFNAKKAHEIVTTLGGIPKTLRTDLEIRTHVSGFLGNALASVGALAEGIISMSAATSKPKHRAGGGDVMAGVPYTINERGFETVTFPAGGTVHPANLSPAGGVARVVVDVRGGEELFKSWVRSWIRGEGGNVQTVLGSR